MIQSTVSSIFLSLYKSELIVLLVTFLILLSQRIIKN